MWMISAYSDKFNILSPDSNQQQMCQYDWSQAGFQKQNSGLKESWSNMEWVRTKPGEHPIISDGGCKLSSCNCRTESCAIKSVSHPAECHQLFCVQLITTSIDSWKEELMENLHLINICCWVCSSMSARQLFSLRFTYKQLMCFLWHNREWKTELQVRGKTVQYFWSCDFYLALVWLKLKKQQLESYENHRYIYQKTLTQIIFRSYRPVKD